MHLTHNLRGACHYMTYVYMICKSQGKFFPVFKTKATLIYILNLLNWAFWAFLSSENDVIFSVKKFIGLDFGAS